MPILTQEELKAVAAEKQRPAISIFLPTHRAGPEIQQDSIRLKNLLKKAGEQLIAEGSRPAEARELLAPVSNLINDAAFWRHQADGLALLRSRDTFRIYRVPLDLPEFVAVSDRFYVKPLLPLLINDARFYVLALSKKAVRVLECTKDTVQALDVPDIPQGTDEALPVGDTPQSQLYARPVTLAHPGAEMFHGHGEGIDDAEVANMMHYCRRIDEGLRNVLKESRAPLILACVDSLAPYFRSVASHRPILEPIVSGNPDDLSAEQLHQKAWPIAEPHFHEARVQAAAQFHEGLAKGRAGQALADVLTAAHQGRIATLFVGLGLQRWGRFDFDRLQLNEHEEEQPEDEELLDLAAMQTLLHGGTVYGVPPGDVPGGHPLAAVYRF